jgi:hypothetical protein
VLGEETFVGGPGLAIGFSLTVKGEEGAVNALHDCSNGSK